MNKQTNTKIKGGKSNTLFPSAKSMSKDPRNIVENAAETAGGAQIPDPGDVPGGVMTHDSEGMLEAVAEAKLRKKIGKEIKEDKR